MSGKKPKNPGGRPTKYTPELADLICERVAINAVGIDKIIEMYDDMPGSNTIKVWRIKYPEFQSKYLAAKSLQAQILVEDIDFLIPEQIKYYIDDKGNERIDAPSASLLIAKINNRKWTAARLAPKIYAEKQNQEHSNSDDSFDKFQDVVNEHKEKIKSNI